MDAVPQGRAAPVPAAVLPDALGSWLVSCRGTLFTMLVCRGYSHASADDAVQDALVRALQWIAAGRFAAITDPLAWLRVVALNAARTNAPRRHLRPLGEGRASAARPFDAFDGADETRARLGAVRVVLDGLPAPLGAVFTYCALEGHTRRAAARHFQLPLGTIMSAVRRAQTAVHRALGEGRAGTKTE
ncbi:rna polymerase subunit sigma- partial : RNA polymerase sigma factor OS=Methylobacterium sp. (strain 4-46) GN=M446_0623 PE=3 SV=1: Sigma70_r2: Sigma70_r4_2 [Gemmata massiliana]|uniref:Uncharacterized protein n=1 Tax=Gemmata massiliana TaxID=1210884 RepID=A0A6P2CYF4_9BACT|nr:RNA polymerase sigma factor [Gemmata massiliana]VTR93416.1 rna polymerase subunit sigma- partial : RNA polymerase sigma factor OS=Methylobacterium sp. (strain 4-46) GN=M446_0623 PE=3 SV=1: Sigma70_r2: Sigma70_r4_2 [Gemmata massiliana]